MDYNAKNAKRWSVVGERPTFGLSLFEKARDDPNIIVVTADVTNSAGLERMKRELPDQVINVGIAEQNMMGIATGLSSEGYTVFTSTFAPFQSMRCLEQIRVNQGYMKQKVIMVGLAGGVAYGELGFTHCTMEDVAIMRAIPNITVVTPADCAEVAKTVEAAINYDGSLYIRLMDKSNVPIVYAEDYDFEIGRAVSLIEEGDITILANGPVVHYALEAARSFYEDTGVKAAVYDFHTIKPIDKKLLDELAEHSKAILTVEEHSVIGGLGSAIVEYYSDRREKMPVYRMGFPDQYPHAASHETILTEFNLTKNGIFNKLKTIMEEMK